MDLRKIYIAEIAGKDSIAAVVNFMNNVNEKITILPTVVYTSTEYGNIDVYTKSISFLKSKEKKYDVDFEKTQILHNEKLWNILNAKYQYMLYKKYGFFTPCIFCHFYAHLIRIPLYLRYKALGIITGERMSHDGRIKANQHPITLRCFSYLFNKYGINLVLPNYNIEKTEKIDKFIEDEDILENVNNVKCVLSGNLCGFSFEDEKNILLFERFIKDYVEPVGDFCIKSIINEEYVDLVKLEKLILSIISEQ